MKKAGNFHRDGGRMHYGMVTSQVEFGTGNYGDIHPKNVPGIVRDVQATPLSDSEIKLSWIADEHAGFYCITRDGKRLMDIGPEVRPQQFLDDKLENSRTYTYTIQAFDARGNPGPVSLPVTAATTAPLAQDWIGVNIQGGAVVIDGRVWQGGDSRRNVTTVSDNYSHDHRIRTIKLTPDPHEYEPLLRSFAGQVSIGHLPQTSCRFPRIGRGMEEALVWVYVVDVKGCGTLASFDLFIQGVRVMEYHSSNAGNWDKFGPFVIHPAEGQPLVIEGKHFLGVGGIAAVEAVFRPL